ncbi:hypothetical protein SGLAM104S_08041 [Streptomyces glaucescens]
MLWNHPTVAAVALVIGVSLAVLVVLAVLAAADRRAVAPAATGESRPGPAARPDTARAHRTDSDEPASARATEGSRSALTRAG